MTIEDIKKLIAGDENRTLELKKTTGELKDAMHSACAFLNTEGGWLIFGIAPKSLKIIGQQVSDATRQEIANALVGLEPVMDVRVEYIEVPDSAGKFGYGGKCFPKDVNAFAKMTAGTPLGTLLEHLYELNVHFRGFEEHI